MRIVALQKRQDHDTSLHGAAALCGALLLAALTALPSQSATAQGAVPCTAIDNDAERLACYDRALRAAPQPAPTPPAAPAPARNAPPAAAPAAPATPSTAVAEPRRERRVRESAARTAPAAPSAGRNNDEAQIVPIVVVSMRALPGRETTFTTEDGTSWVQTDSQRIDGLPDTPFDAEIKPGAMGSYFLVAKDRPRAIRVRPVR